MKFKTLVSTLFTTITLTTVSYAGNKFASISMDDGLMIFVSVPTENLDLPPGLSEELVNTLSYMGNEERLAYDVYNRLYAEWGIKTFTNIANKSEIKHIQAVQDLIQKYKLNDLNHFTNVDLPALGYMNTAVENMEAGTYDISKIQRLYDDLVSEGARSQIDALNVGCIVEVVDINDLDEYIHIAEASNASDVVDTFNFLRNGSYNHYWSFDKALKQRGVADGCCALGTVDGVNYCHPEYPLK